MTDFKTEGPVTEEDVRKWMNAIKDGTDTTEHCSAEEGKRQYDAVLSEFENLLAVLGVGHGSLDTADVVALMGITGTRVFGP